MPKKIIEFKSDDQEPIYVEVDVPPAYSTTRGGGDASAEEDGAAMPAGRFRKAMSTVKTVSKDIVAMMNNMDVRPDEVEVKIALKASSGTGNLWNFVLVKAEGEGTIEFTMRWNGGKDKKEA